MPTTRCPCGPEYVLHYKSHGMDAESLQPASSARSLLCRSSMGDTSADMVTIANGDMENAYVDNQNKAGKGKPTYMKWLLALLSCVALSVGSSSNILLSRFYFMHGGSHRWLVTWLQSAGWPIILCILLVMYVAKSRRPNPITVKMFLNYCALGILLSIINLLFAWGFSYLPASTTSLLLSGQLAFNSVFALIIVRHKFTPYSINSVILLVFSSVLLACDSGSDRPAGVTPKQYVTGFLMSIAGAALNGLFLPLLQLAYNRMAQKSVTISMVLEMQVFVCTSASAFCILAMVIAGDMKELWKEAKSFDVGEIKYFVTLSLIALSSQVLFLGNVSLIFLTSALLAGVFTSFLLPITGLLAVLFFHDNFTRIKAMATLLAVWGFISYLYGGYKESKRQKEIIDHDDDQQSIIVSSHRLANDVSEPAPPNPHKEMELAIKR